MGYVGSVSMLLTLDLRLTSQRLVLARRYTTGKSVSGQESARNLFLKVSAELTDTRQAYHISLYLLPERRVEWGEVNMIEGSSIIGHDRCSIESTQKSHASPLTTCVIPM
jgi:hypothetical protein